MHPLRTDYQLPFKQDLAISVKQHKHVLAVSPGGTGKSTVFAHIAKDASQLGRTVIILTHRKNIFEQNQATAMGIELNAKTPQNLVITTGTVYVAMAQTIKFRDEWINQFNALPKPVLILVDECDDATFNTVLDAIPNRLTIGFTATANYKDARHLPLYYNALVETKPISWFILHEKNYLCSYEHVERSAKDIDSYLVKLNGDFTEKSQTSYFSSKAIYGGLIEDLVAFKFTKCMIFCSSIKNAETTWQEVTEAGYKASIGHSKRQDEDEQIKRFKDPLSGFDILISVSAYVRGFDHPPVDQLMFYKAFGTLSGYLQACYRADRPHIPTNKTNFRVIDYGNNKRHGLYFFDRPWQKLWRPESLRMSQKEQGIEPIKECPSCHRLIGLMAKVCPYCDFVQPVNEAMLKDGDLIDITAAYTAMKGRRIGTLSARELSIYSKLLNKAQFAIRIAKSHRQREIEVRTWDIKPIQGSEPYLTDIPPNYLKDFAHYMGYKAAWAYQQEKMLKDIEQPIIYANIVLK